MAVILNPYLQFHGSARAALEFYQEVFGGELSLDTFGDFGVSDDPEEAGKIMHGQLHAQDLILMAADAPGAHQEKAPASVAIALSGGAEDEADLRRHWEGLTDGGTIIEPLTTAPWGDAFGMVTDRFGTQWFVNIGAAPSS